MSFGRGWTFDDDQLLKRRWCAGIPLQKIAVELGRTRSVVRRRLHTLGIYDPDRNQRCSWTPEVDARLVALWADLSITAAQIGNRLGTTGGAIKLRAAKLGLPRRSTLYAIHRKVRQVVAKPEPELPLDDRHFIICRNAGGFIAFTETWAGRGSVPQSISLSKDWRLGPPAPALRRAA